MNTDEHRSIVTTMYIGTMGTIDLLAGSICVHLRSSVVPKV